MNAAGAILVSLFSVAALTLPRRYVALCLLAATLYITEGQNVNLGINFMAIRFVELAVFIRIVLRGELSRLTFTAADRWLLIFFCAVFGLYSLRTGIFDYYQFGTAVDALLVYFGARALITNSDDFTFFVRSAVFLLIPFALLMFYEATAGKNLFALMGGVPESPELREGHYRCQGSFRHAITAGTVGATFVSLFVGYFILKPRRHWALVGIVACIVIVLASHSSGPLMAAVTAVAGWGCWFLRQRMKFVRRGIVATLIALNFMMSAPVWFIFDRLSGILGGDGWHRSNLIDKFIKSFGEWCFAGMSFQNTADWAATQLPWGGVDVTNYYVSVGILGGLLSFVALLIFITVCFKLVGRAGAALRAQPEPRPYLEAMLWGAGCTVCAHVVNLTAVIYWDQSYVIWYLHLALAVSLSSHILSTYPLDALPSAQSPEPTEAVEDPAMEDAPASRYGQI